MDMAEYGKSEQNPNASVAINIETDGSTHNTNRSNSSKQKVPIPNTKKRNIVDAPTKGRDRSMLGAKVDNKTERLKERSLWEHGFRHVTLTGSRCWVSIHWLCPIVSHKVVDFWFKVCFTILSRHTFPA
jgi:hypothetical protein